MDDEIRDEEGEKKEEVARVCFGEKEGSLFDLILFSRLTNDSYIHRSRPDLFL